MKRLAFLLTAGLLLAGCGGVQKSFHYDYRWEGEPVSYRFPHPQGVVGINLAPVSAIELTDRQKQDVRDAFEKWHEAGGPEAVEVAPDAGAAIDVLVQESGEFEVSQDNGSDGFGSCGVYAPPATPSSLQKAVICIKAGLPERVFRYTALHEAGHALGLDHSGQVGDVMYPYQYNGYTPLVELSSGDKKAVEERYDSVPMRR